MKPINPLPILEAGQSERTFYVVFSDAHELPSWFKPFTCEEFEHCFVMAQVGLVCCAVEQSNYAIMQHTYWNTVDPGKVLDADDLASIWAQCGYKIVKFSTTFSEDNRVWCLRNALPTCVNLCKNLLGISTWHQTPKGLYCWLMENGGQIVEGKDYGK